MPLQGPESSKFCDTKFRLSSMMLTNVFDDTDATTGAPMGATTGAHMGAPMSAAEIPNQAAAGADASEPVKEGTGQRNDAVKDTATPDAETRFLQVLLMVAAALVCAMGIALCYYRVRITMDEAPPGRRVPRNFVYD
eukprot:CAMPEP_0114261046 /NCGR_PEP_ID=MMETSP0058-20121206/20878_1 /TAXON_ID=36894 /ORGANISM="Pyramimonas parkeae, CCMP726" /LENGTH=136 /DNA_ID=CAMNT_0001376455 /DNA_START=784 /DNA_END=1195 /DNA_ORIENTATION=+